MKKYFLLVSSCLVAISHTAFAEIKTATTCSGKCTFYYDTETHDLRFEKNADVPEGEEVIIPANLYRGGITGSRGSDEDRTIKNVTIGEGITGAGEWAISTYGGYTSGTAESVLKLPSSLKLDAGINSFWNISFGTIDASALKDTVLKLPTSAEQTVILAPDSNVKLIAGGAYGANPPITIQCKGSDLQACQNMVQTSKELSVEYYKGYDDKGNILEEWGPNGKTTYTYKYDGGGNLVGCVDSHGNRIYGKKIYTIEEAEAATAKGDKFHVSLTYK